MKLTGKVALVTGSNTGLGFETALALSKECGRPALEKAVFGVYS